MGLGTGWERLRGFQTRPLRKRLAGRIRSLPGWEKGVDQLSQLQQVYGLIVVTGHRAERTTLSATLPNMIFSSPL
jgi:hypothetical protein